MRKEIEFYTYNHVTTIRVQGLPILLHLLSAELVKGLASITVRLQFSLSFDLDPEPGVYCICAFKQQPWQGEIWKDFQVDVRRVWDSRPPTSSGRQQAVIKVAIASAVQRINLSNCYHPCSANTLVPILWRETVVV